MVIEKSHGVSEREKSEDDAHTSISAAVNSEKKKKPSKKHQVIKLFMKL